VDLDGDFEIAAGADFTIEAEVPGLALERAPGAGTVQTRWETWRLRGLDGEILRGWSYEDDLSKPIAERFSWSRDYVYRNGGGLLATESPSEGRLNYYLDHLGTPVLVARASADPTDGQGDLNFTFAFGEDMGLAGLSENVPLRFTGHERDFHVRFTGEDRGDLEDDVDYMHARSYWPLYGRFLSVDPVAGDPRMPQSWNRYAYVLGNPTNYVDPFGLEGERPRIRFLFPFLPWPGNILLGPLGPVEPFGEGGLDIKPSGIETVEDFFLKLDRLLEFAVCGNDASRTPGGFLESALANVTLAGRLNLNGVVGFYGGIDGRGTVTASLRGISIRPGIGVGGTGPTPSGGNATFTGGLLFGSADGFDGSVGISSIPLAGPSGHLSGKVSTAGDLSAYLGLGAGIGTPTVSATVGRTFAFKTCGLLGN
jgi:RHS repeat-associated protein